MATAAHGGAGVRDIDPDNKICYFFDMPRRRRYSLLVGAQHNTARAARTLAHATFARAATTPTVCCYYQINTSTDLRSTRQNSLRENQIGNFTQRRTQKNIIIKTE